MGINLLRLDESEQPTRVGIGLIERSGRFLIRQRLAGQAMAGYWEFPGGKCEADETPEAATERECLEEVGVEVVVGESIRQVTHRYSHGLVELHYFRCRIRETRDEPRPDSGFRWVAADDLLRYRFPEANEAVIEVLALEFAESKDSNRDKS